MKSHTLGGKDYVFALDMDIDNQIIPILLEDHKRLVSMEARHELFASQMEYIALVGNDNNMIEVLAASANIINQVIIHIKTIIKDTNNMIYDLETTRNKASYASKYWKKEDSLKYASWLQYFTKVNKLLTLSDKEILR